jgi:hypothetical protein
MPANPKYLTHSISQKIAKVAAAILGGYLVSASFHVALASWLPNYKAVLITSVYTLFLLWCALMVFPFLAKNGWLVWAVYLSLTLVFCIAAYFGKITHPIV